MNLRDEWRERVAEALPCTPRCYPATRSGHSNGCTRSRHTTADQLLAPGGVVAGIVAEAWRASRLDIAYELRESGAWAEVRMAEWVEMRADREALKAAQNPPSDGRARSGEGAGPSDGAEGAERGEG